MLQANSKALRTVIIEHAACKLEELRILSLIKQNDDL